ncbi:hypothetical protein BDZ85DRAFT_266046 [Elsinoe ampelina]|uniref:Uncharacterized protein n=1 Tax=Elsinoe ampelina TaxID=302913 RepID=A0A6A6G5A3_9PEZI|nr:hypothetical protein BDZ85DRAFT_266046 [Elsinoe ampelina]
MGDGALGSDHVNYLVLRYLQESGFESAAKSLYREWYRNDQYRDPEQFPFAGVVKQHELVHIIQDGLFHDQLQATVANGPRRFTLTSNDVEQRTQRNKSLSRRQSVYTSNDQDEFALPAAKRVRQSNASDTLTNGDAMDVDDQRDEYDRTSNPSDQDRAQSEPEQVEQIIIETKAMGTQTDVKKKIRTQTMYWSIDKSSPVSILHTAWSPATASSSFLLAAGESLCRVYDVTRTSDSYLNGIENIDPLPMGPEHTVTAISWHPSGQYLTCALQGPSRVDGVQAYKAQLVDVSPSGDKRPYDDAFNMVTIALRYTRSGNTLFSASSDGQRSVLELRDTTSPKHHGLAVALGSVDNLVVDIAPISETSFAACGKGLVSVWTMKAAENNDDPEGATLVQTYVHAVPADINFDKIRYDWRHELLVAVATTSGHVCTLQKSSEGWSHGPSLTLPSDVGSRITAICFEPSSRTASEDRGHPKLSNGVLAPTRLAIGMMNDQSGSVCLYNTSSDGIALFTSLELEQQEPPLALSWTTTTIESDGTQARLAAASDEAIRIWDVTGKKAEDLLSWKAAPANWYQGDDNHLPDDEDATEPSLAWDIKGERLAFAVGRKMAIVSMAPEPATNGVNGTTTDD